MAVESFAHAPSLGQARLLPQPRAIAEPLVKWAYTLFALAFVFDIFAPLMGGGKGASAGYENRQAGNTAFEILAIPIYGASLPFILVGFRSFLRTLPKTWPFLALLGLTLVSTAWSVQPDVTIRRSIGVIMTMLFAYYAATSLKQREMLTMTVIVVTVITVASLGLVAIGQGSEHAGRHFGDLRGIYPNKNLFGEFTGLSCIIYAFTAFRGSSALERWTARVMLPIEFGLLWGSDARTPLVAAVGAGAFVYLLFFLFRPHGWQRRLALEVRTLFIAVGVLAGLVALAAAVTIVLSLLGRNLTLTGRFHLWQYAIGLGVPRQWLGAGFKAFWTDAITFNLRVLHRAWTGNQVGSDPLTGNGHDGYLDIWLELGWLGVVIFLLFLGSYASKVIRAIRSGAGSLVEWNTAILGFMILFSLTNSIMLEHSEMGWFMFSYAYLALAAEEARPKLQATPQARRPAQRTLAGAPA